MVVTETKKLKTKNIQKNIVEEKQETEQEIVEIQQKDEHKIIKMRKSSRVDEYIDDEQCEELETQTPTPIKQLPTESSKIHSEILVLDSIVSLAPETRKEAQAHVNLITNTAAITEEMIVGELEETKSFKMKNVTDEAVELATINVTEGFQVSEVDLKETIGHVKPIEKSLEAKAEFIPNKSVVVQEPIASDDLGELKSSKSIESKVKIEFLVHDAKIVTETLISQQEDVLSEPLKPIYNQAIKDTLTHEGIEITEVNKAEAESQLTSTLKSAPLKAKYKLSESIPLEITEVFTEDKPSKYYPEVVVATENAVKSFIEQKPYVVQETNAPELEDVYEPVRLPQQQLAESLLQTSESIQISESLPQETEDKLVNETAPQIYQATGTFNELEPLSTTIVDIQFPAKEWQQPEFDTKLANIEFIEKLPLSMLMVNVSETEQSLEPPEPTKTTQALTSGTYLQTSEEILPPLIQEREQDLVDEQKTATVAAKCVVDKSDAFETDNQQVLETEKPLITKTDYKTIEASMSYQLTEPIENIYIVPHDKEATFVGKLTVEHSKATTAIDLQKSVHVLSENANEKEEILEIFSNTDIHLATTMPTEMLKSIIVEEVQTSSRTNEVKPMESKLSKAKIISDEQEVMTIEENVSLDTVKDLKRDDSPEHYIAETSIIEQRSIQVTSQNISEAEEDLKAAQNTITHTVKSIPTQLFKPLTVEEIETGISVGEFCRKDVLQTKPNVVQNQQDEVSVTEMVAYESLDRVKALTKPTEITATTGLLEQKYIEVMQTQLTEQESQFNVDDKFENQTANKTSVDTVKSIIVEQIEPEFHLQTIDKSDLKLVKPKVVQQELDEISISESVPLESIDNLRVSENLEQPINATHAFIEQLSIQITTNNAEEYERNIDDIFKYDTQIVQSSPAKTEKSLIVEEIKLMTTAEELLPKDLLTVKPKVTQSNLEEMSVSETILFDNVDVFKGAIENVEPAIQLSQCLFEKKSIQVTSQEISEKESTFETKPTIDCQAVHTQSSDAIKSLIVEEVETAISTTDIQPATFKAVQPKVFQTNLEEILVSEITTLEDISKLKMVDKPLQTTANYDFDEKTYIQVTTQELVEHENNLNTATKAANQTAHVAQCDTVVSVVVEEIQPSIIAENFETIDTKSNTPKLVQSQLEEMSTSEVISYESTDKLSKVEKLQESTLGFNFTEQHSIQITTQEAAEKEHDLQELLKIVEQKAHSVDSQTSKSVIVQEIETVVSTEELKRENTNSMVKPRVIQTELEEISVEEMIPFDYLRDLGIIEKHEQIDVALEFDEEISIQVTQQEVVESEQNFDSVDKSEQHSASVSSKTTSKSIVVEQIETSENTDEIKPKDFSFSNAKCIQNKLEEMQITEAVPLEGVNDFKKIDKPVETIVAATNFTEQKSVQVMVHETSEKEEDTQLFQKVDQYVASTTQPDAIHSLEVCEVETAQSAGYIPITSTIDVRPKVTQNELDQMLVSETTVYEGVKGIDLFNIPKEYANLEFNTVRSFEVTEKRVEDNEQAFEAHKEPKKLADCTTTSNIKKSIAVEETETSQTVFEEDVKDLLKTKAKVINDKLEETTTFEPLPFEDLRELKRFENPNVTQADQLYDEQSALVIIQQEVSEKEQSLIKENDVNLSTSITPSDVGTKKSIVVKEIEVLQTVSDVIKNDIPKTTASVTCTPLNATNIIETIPFEEIKDYKSACDNTEIKIADQKLDLLKSIQVSSNTIVEKEEAMPSALTVIEHNATPTTSHELKMVVTEKVETNETVDDLSKTEQLMKNAIVAQEQLDETSVYDLVLLESFDELNQSATILTKLAQPVLDEHKSVIVTTSEIGENETNLTIQPEITQQISQLTVDILTSISIEEVQTISTTKEFTDASDLSEKPKIVQPKLNETSVSEVISYEGIQDFKKKEESLKFGVTALNEQQSLIVTTNIAEESEQQLNVQQELSRKITPLPTDTFKQINVEEVQPISTTKDFTQVSQLSERPVILQPSVNEMQIIETIPYEGVYDFQKQEAISKLADSILNEQKHLVVTTNKAEEKELNFTTSPKVTQQIAVPLPLDTLESINVEEIHTLSTTKNVGNVNELLDTQKLQKSLRPIIDEQKSVIVTTNIPVESEINLEIMPEGSQKIKLSPLDTFKSIYIEEVQTLSSTKDFTDISCISESPKVVQTGINETQVSETFSYENVVKFDKQDKFEEKSLIPVIDEQSSLIVETQDIPEHESQLADSQINLNQFANKVQSHALKAVLTEKVHIGENTQDIYETRNESKARILQNEFEETTTSETIAYENINEKNELKPTEKCAISILDVKDSIIVSLNESTEHESEFLEKPTAIKSKAKKAPTHTLISAVVDENEAIPSIDNFLPSNQMLDRANIKQDQFEQTDIFESTVFESTGTCIKIQHPNVAEGDSIFDIHTPLTISTVETETIPVQIKDVNPDELERGKFVHTDNLITAIVEEVNPNDAIEVLSLINETQKLKTITSELKVSSKTQTFLYENIDNHITKPPVTQTIKPTSIDTNMNSGIITETLSNEKENEFSQFSDSVSAVAAINIVPFNLAVNQETQPNDITNILNQKIQIKNKAQLKQTCNESITIEEIETNESLCDFLVSKPKQYKEIPILGQLEALTQLEFNQTETINPLIVPDPSKVHAIKQQNFEPLNIANKWDTMTNEESINLDYKLKDKFYPIIGQEEYLKHIANVNTVYTQNLEEIIPIENENFNELIEHFNFQTLKQQQHVQTEIKFENLPLSIIKTHILIEGRCLFSINCF